MLRSRSTITAAACLLAAWTAAAAGKPTDAEIAALAERFSGASIAQRQDMHRNPELSNRETRTGALVAEHLKKLGIEVQTGIAHTGVVGILRGGRPGPTIAVRAFRLARLKARCTSPGATCPSRSSSSRT